MSNKDRALESSQDGRALSTQEDKGRRTFLRGALTAGGAAIAGGAELLVGGSTATAATATAAPAAGTRGSALRSAQALAQRISRATINLAGPFLPSENNGDERALAGYIGSYSKGLPHNDLGEVDASAYNKMLTALSSGMQGDYAAIPLGGTAKLANPQAAFAFQMEGKDVARHRIAAPPTFSSEQRAAEMNEVYWMALARDIPFSAYASHALASSAVSDLTRYTLWSGLTTGSLFRGPTAGDRAGPYISQFLWRDVPYGPTTIVQKYQAGVAGQDFMTGLTEAVNIQRGLAPSQALTLDGSPHHIRNGRDLAEYVHKDFSYQAFLNAALIALGFGGAALDDANPYKAIANQGAFLTFGGPDVLSMVAQVAELALKAAWWQKWAINRNLRPEVFAIRVHHQLKGLKSYPIHPKMLLSSVLPELQSRYSGYLLPMAFAEGSPTHPTYPAGHAVIAGACVTVLKAFFKESFVIPNAVEASADGSALSPWAGESLTLGGELNKLASNIAIGRNIAGVHYWSDGVEGLKLGEQVAIAYLADLKTTYAETFAGFSLTRFDGQTITVK